MTARATACKDGGATLVTGAAGFIGYHVARRLLESGEPVTGVDHLGDYYDPSLKAARLALLAPHPGFRFERCDLADRAACARVFAATRFRRVIHLAAQPGVRYSLVNPHAYLDDNVTAFLNVLEGCRHHPVQHLVFASSSSVYGGNVKVPFSASDAVDHPVSLYAATKRANELMAHTYAHLFALPVTALRFFTVYGPWGRPDMAPMLFTKAILEGAPIEVFNEGHLWRDFTYVDDVVEAVARVAARPPRQDAAYDASAPAADRSYAPFRVYNVGNDHPVELLDFIATLERLLGRTARITWKPMQPGDVIATWADVSSLERDFDCRPRTPLEQGLRAMTEWYRGHFGVEGPAASPGEGAPGTQG
jgi:UDP-glucuronate 4-epimerase